jgi:neopullulanase
MTVAEHWLRFGMDGWRLDVPEEINDVGFWQEFRRRCRAIQPDAYLVAEIWHVAPEWLHGDRFDATMDYPMTEAILGFAGGSRLDMAVVHSQNEYKQNISPLDGPAFAGRLEDLLDAYESETVAAQLHLLGSHDTPRARSVLGDDLTGLRLAMLIQATLPGAPCIYYGDEVGVSGAMDPDNRRAFPWDEARWDHSLRRYQQVLIGLRRSEPALRADAVVVVGAAGGGVAYLRRLDGVGMVVAINAGDEPVQLDLALPGEHDGTTLTPIILEGADGTASEAEATVHDGSASLGLGPRSGSILRLT